mmetsp:Transcript_11358/g.17865  ORF Transcript_11358/g.17865 Transcript_11358/m.17865 type:complete len:292 (-) Transcript_11358:28-903(-)
MVVTNTEIASGLQFLASLMNFWPPCTTLFEAKNTRVSCPDLPSIAPRTPAIWSQVREDIPACTTSARDFTSSSTRFSCLRFAVCCNSATFCRPLTALAAQVHLEDQAKCICLSPSLESRPPVRGSRTSSSLPRSWILSTLAGNFMHVIPRVFDVLSLASALALASPSSAESCSWLRATILADESETRASDLLMVVVARRRRQALIAADSPYTPNWSPNGCPRPFCSTLAFSFSRYTWRWLHSSTSSSAEEDGVCISTTRNLLLDILSMAETSSCSRSTKFLRFSPNCCFHL